MAKETVPATGGHLRAELPPGLGDAEQAIRSGAARDLFLSMAEGEGEALVGLEGSAGEARTRYELRFWDNLAGGAV